MRVVLLAASLAPLSSLACKDKATPGAGVPVDDATISCETTFTYRTGPDVALDGVSVVGDFNSWNSASLPMTQTTDGLWTATTTLEPGPHPYRFVEQIAWSQDTYEVAVCDPEAELIHCEDGYKEPWETDWTHTCQSGTESSCNSLIVVRDCGEPSLQLLSLDIDRVNGAVTAEAAIPASAAAIATVSVTLDGDALPDAWDGSRVRVDQSGLANGRHTIRIHATDADGRDAPELYIPFWVDGYADPRDGWRDGSMYFAFVDRFVNADTSNDGEPAASAELGAYMGGDFAGVRAALPYLDDLGVRTLWISNPQDNAEGAFDGDCDETYAGYHAYWPDSARGMEEHFGDEDDLHALVDDAHARGMRVVMDWVANHVHEDHPYAANDWFNSQLVCMDSVGGQQNWDRIPEACWFAPYLPDIDYTDPEPLDLMVDDALWWVKTYELDGLRVDAVKHMPHSVAWNLEARVRSEIEHRAVGGTEEFWTVGETFDGTERIAAYITQGDTLLQLDGQFDFPLYYAVRSVLGSQSGSLTDLAGAVSGSRANFDGALMSAFLGNHDVGRFTSVTAQGDVSSCTDGGLQIAQTQGEDWVYARLRMAWTFLFTQPDVPLVYYGDEAGLPGYSDPDNRQPFWWYTGDAIPSGIDAVTDTLPSDQAAVVAHVSALGTARQANPAMWRGDAVEWWLGPSDWATAWAYARVDPIGGGASITLLNTGYDDATIENGLSYAGLPVGGEWEDVLTGERFYASGDWLSVTVPGTGSRVLVAR